ncbi:unnamed protein product [Closterium sp. Naga37s-1]|nr:unnamed protein product [Closterium sp. Naga37s-1]
MLRLQLTLCCHQRRALWSLCVTVLITGAAMRVVARDEAVLVGCSGFVKVRRMLSCVRRVLSCVRRVLSCVRRVLSCVRRVLSCVRRVLSCGEAHAVVWCGASCGEVAHYGVCGEADHVVELQSHDGSFVHERTHCDEDGYYLLMPPSLQSPRFTFAPSPPLSLPSSLPTFPLPHATLLPPSLSHMPLSSRPPSPTCHSPPVSPLPSTLLSSPPSPLIFPSHESFLIALHFPVTPFEGSPPVSPLPSSLYSALVFASPPDFPVT